MAFRATRSLRATAASAAFLVLPLASRRPRQARASASPKDASPSQRPTVACKRSQSHQGCDLLAADRAELGEVSQECCRHDASHPGDALKPLQTLRQGDALRHLSLDLSVQTVDLAIEPLDVIVD